MGAHRRTAEYVLNYQFHTGCECSTNMDALCVTNMNSGYMIESKAQVQQVSNSLLRTGLQSHHPAAS